MSEEGFFCKAKERVLQNFEKIEKNSDQGYRDDEQFTLNKDKCIGDMTSKPIKGLNYQCGATP